MNDVNDQQLLRDYTESRSEPAFAELVRRHVDLVYSAALRMVCDTHLAEDVTQASFVALAQNARQLTGHPVLSGWLHRTTQNLAANTVRGEVRRRAREQEAAAMNELLSAESDATWEQIAPQLDAVLGELSEPDRDALLLRYFERKSAREMAQTLGVSDEAAQKRVNRAVERLRELLVKRGVTIGASGLVAGLSANAVQSAPAGLAGTISTAAALAGTTTATVIATTKTIAMTTLQKTLFTAIIAAAIGSGIYQARQNSQLRGRLRTLEQQQAPLTRQIETLQRERDGATNRLAVLADENANLKKHPADLLKLRGEVSRLKQESASSSTNSPLNKLFADPAVRKMMRDQQKLGMSMIYHDFIESQKLPKDQAAKFKDLLADDVMDNIDQISAVRRDGKTGAELNQVFADQDAAFLGKVSALLGPDGLAQYEDFNRNLLSKMTADQFKDQLGGDAAAKTDTAKQLAQVIQATAQQALTTAGLPADYQLIPMLNFRNIASEEQGEQSLTLLNSIYQDATSRASSILSPDELAKFKEFTATAIDNNRTALNMNRKIMSPGSQ